MGRIMQMKNEAVSIPIILMVISSLILSIISLTYFVFKNNNTAEIIKISDELDQVYLEQALLNFYLQDVFDKAVENFNPSQGKPLFIDNFKKEYLKYKSKDGRYPINSMASIESYVLNGNLIDSAELDKDRLVLKMSLTIQRGIIDYNGVVANYN